MSHFTTLQTQITDLEALVKALSDLGYANVETHPRLAHLEGYQGDRRPETAELIIRRRYVGPLSNDIGFRRDASGTFTAIVSEYDRAKHSDEWLGLLSQRYAYHVAREKLEEQGFSLVEESLQDGQIRMVLRRVG